MLTLQHLANTVLAYHGQSATDTLEVGKALALADAINSALQSMQQDRADLFSRRIPLKLNAPASGTITVSAAPAIGSPATFVPGTLTPYTQGCTFQITGMTRHNVATQIDPSSSGNAWLMLDGYDGATGSVAATAWHDAYWLPQSSGVPSFLQVISSARCNDRTLQVVASRRDYEAGMFKREYQGYGTNLLVNDTAYFLRATGDPRVVWLEQYSVPTAANDPTPSRVDQYLRFSPMPDRAVTVELDLVPAFPQATDANLNSTSVKFYFPGSLDNVAIAFVLKEYMATPYWKGDQQTSAAIAQNYKDRAQDLMDYRGARPTVIKPIGARW